MKLILTQEVTGLGAPGDVVEVKDGYGRNYLVPRGLGIRWTRGAEKTVDSIKAARNSRALRGQDHAEEIRARRVTGNCVQHQRDVAIAVKNAREVALLPYTSTGR